MISPFVTVTGLVAALRRGGLSCEEIAGVYLARIARHDERLNAFVTVLPGH